MKIQTLHKVNKVFRESRWKKVSERHILIREVLLKNLT